MTHTFKDEDLDAWKKIGEGGFGDVHKVKAKKMGHNVAIKFLSASAGNVLVQELKKEAYYLKLLSCTFVLPIYGMYEGIPSFGTVKQLGMVMEYMKRGSIETLCKKLSGPPPFPLACRLIHEVALGMNFLHSLGILHRDLKPQNVMLSDELHVKLADFGLSTESTSIMGINEIESDKGKSGSIGTLRYMAPEAMGLNYKPVRSLDIYSYAVLVWSILSGEEPYPVASNYLITIKVPEGVRPTLEELSKKNAEGMKDLLDLMKKCWDGDAEKRPPFKDCVGCSGKVYLKHKPEINKVVYQVLEKLDWGIDVSASEPALQVGQKNV